MADTSPLAGLLDRASHVFRLAWQLARTFQEERGTGGGFRQIDPTSWTRNQPTFNEFCAAILDLRDAMQNPPEGFFPVAQALLKAAGIAKQIRDVMQTSDGRTWAAFLDFFPDLNSVAAEGREAIQEVTRARRLDDPFAFVDQAAAGKGSDIDTTPTLPRPPQTLIDAAARAKGLPAEVPLDASTLAAGQGMLAHIDSLATSNTVMRQMVVDLGARHAGGAASVRGGPADAHAGTTPSARSDNAALALMRVFTNGIADERIQKAARLLADSKLTANEKLTEIDALIPFPATVSAEQLGDMLGVTKQAVLKTDWWIQNRKGEKDSEIGRRREGHCKRAKRYEAPGQDDESE
jgi:hypothetical protein